MPAEIGSDRFGNFASFECESGFFKFRHHLAFAKRAQRAAVARGTGIFGIHVRNQGKVGFGFDGLVVDIVNFQLYIVVVLFRRCYRDGYVFDFGSRTFFEFAFFLGFILFFDLRVAHCNTVCKMVIEPNRLSRDAVGVFGIFGFQAVGGDIGLFLDLILQGLAGQIHRHVFIHLLAKLRNVVESGYILRSVEAAIGLQVWYLQNFLRRIVQDCGLDVAFLDLDLVLFDLLIPQDSVYELFPSGILNVFAHVVVDGLTLLLITGCDFLDLLLVHLWSDLSTVHFAQELAAEQGSIQQTADSKVSAGARQAQNESRGNHINYYFLSLSQLIEHLSPPMLGKISFKKCQYFSSSI